MKKGLQQIHAVNPLKYWCRNQESNSGPTDYKSVALPTELLRLSECVLYRRILFVQASFKFFLNL